MIGGQRLRFRIIEDRTDRIWSSWKKDNKDDDDGNGDGDGDGDNNDDQQPLTQVPIPSEGGEQAWTVSAVWHEGRSHRDQGEEDQKTI